jgi:hypothetical protein
MAQGGMEQACVFVCQCVHVYVCETWSTLMDRAADGARRDGAGVCVCFHVLVCVHVCVSVCVRVCMYMC